MKVPLWIVPFLVVVVAASSVMMAGMFSIPSVTIEFERETTGNGQLNQVEMIVDGVTCVDMAKTASVNLESLAGVKKFVAYASHNRVVVYYDPEKVEINDIVKAIEDPVFFEETGEILFDLYKVVEIEGKKTLI